MGRYLCNGHTVVLTGLPTPREVAERKTRVELLLHHGPVGELLSGAGTVGNKEARAACRRISRSSSRIAVGAPVA